MIERIAVHLGLALLGGLFLAPAVLIADEAVKLDRPGINPNDVTSLQRGAAHFVNYCLTCHGASYMRYSRLQDLGLTEAQIKQYLLLTGDKVGDTMTVALDAKDGKEWFGVAPPDLTVIARSRGADWIYTYLKSFYQDESRPTGWNNLVFPNVAMPHVLYKLQGQQLLKATQKKNEEGGTEEIRTLVLDKPGSLSPRDYDIFATDLTNYLVYMGEPAKNTRIKVGIVVMFFLALLFLLTVQLKREYWKDVK